MSIYCNCRHCVAPQFTALKGFSASLEPAPATEDIDFRCLVDEYLALSDSDFNLHWNAVNKAKDEREGYLAEDDDDEE